MNTSLRRIPARFALVMWCLLVGACADDRVADPAIPLGPLTLADTIIVPISHEFVVSPLQQQTIGEEVRGYQRTYERYDVVFETALPAEQVLAYFDQAMLEHGWASVCRLRPSISDPPVERLPLPDSDACALVLGGPFPEDFRAHRMYAAADAYVHADLLIEVVDDKVHGKMVVFRVTELVVP